MRGVRETSLLALLAISTSAFSEGVKYRGIFVNDEDWGLRPWAVRHFGAQEQIGTNAYAEVFALMKANGLNLIWPAMHEGGYEFSARPENLELARRWGIAVGTSHCEPMLRNNCYLPNADKKKWSWVSNREFLVDYWREGVRRGTENGDQGVLWTIGMRGIHDGRMPDGKTTEEKIKILEEVFAAQCAMLPDGAPKLFCPYKEVLSIFNAGLKVPEDATILWVNDNFGYVRRVGAPHPSTPPLPHSPTPNSPTHPIKHYSRQGIYWHLSYWGRPHGYIHLCTTPPAFMWYELVAKCWENGVRDVWMVNAGDVFQAEILLAAFGKFAADPESWGPDAQVGFLSSWATTFLSSRVGKSDVGCPKSDVLAKRIAAHLAEYYNLGFNRKPEHMCVQWTTNLPASVKSSLLKRYHALLKEDLAIEEMFTNLNSDKVGENSSSSRKEENFHSPTPTLNSNSKNSKPFTRLKIADEYFRLVGFQARFLAYAGIIHLEGRDKAYAHSVLDPLYARWDALDGGKWSGFWIDTVDEKPGMYQPTAHNRWSSQMQWPWNEPDDPAQKDRRGESRNDYVATAYRADVPEPTWLEPASRERGAKGGEWVNVAGLGTSGNALALLPVKPGVGDGASLRFAINPQIKQSDNSNNQTISLVLQFLPDFALWPGLRLGVKVSFDGGEAKYVEVPRSDSNIGEKDPVRAVAVQDNFIRVEVPIPSGAKACTITAVDPGVVIDRVGVRTVSADEFRAPRLGVVCETPAQARPGVAKSRAWEQSLLTGNGAMGAMVPGELAHEEIFLSHARLFLPRIMNGRYFELGKYRGKARELALAGREKEIWDEVIQKASDESGYSFKRDPFMGAVSLVVDTPDLPKWSDAPGYRRMTDFERGECTVRTEDYERRIFASRTDGVIAMRVKDAKKRPFTVGFETISNGRPSGDAAIQRIREKDGYMYYRVDFRKENGKNPFHGYEAVGLRRGDEVFVKIYPLPFGTDSMFDTAKRELSAAADMGYARLLERHAPVMKELMGRVTLDLPDRDLVRKFHAGRYNIISSTAPDGVLPNLQGLWAGSWSAPYNGSYTVDGNMPCAMSFWTRGNTPEFNESLYEWIMRYYDDFREAAKKGYNARGIHIPGQVTTTGLETAYYRNVELMWWHGGAGWMTGYLWRWYEATQDIEVLKKVYPLLKDAADYICDCMEEMPDGTLGFAPGYSPENAPHGDFRSQGDVMNPDLPKGGYSTQNNPTMDISVAKQSIDYATKAAKILGRDEASVREWAQKRARLPKYAVSKDGFWAEWLIPGTPDNNSHRHVSHVFALYDEAPAEILTNAAFVAAIKKTLDARMTFHEKENHMAFGVTQIGYAAAKVGDAAVMERAIRLLQETYFTDALGTLHDPGWLFNIDISGGFPGIIADALITKGPDGSFKVLNAKPASWKKGSISGLLLPGGIKVKNLSWQGDSYELELLHPDGRTTVHRK